MKTITRQAVTFKKCTQGYFITMAMQGFETKIEDYNGIIAEGIALGVCSDAEYDNMVKFFMSNVHDIEVTD